jgi:pSer/pThr/pTyr-binding forkhead associated (FHA) protein
MLASLAITAGPLAGQTKSLTSRGILIGRGSGCDLRLVDRSVSRQHARLRYADGAWFVQDLGSAAGTFVNGQRIQAIRIKRGDQIQIGASILVLTLPT